MAPSKLSEEKDTSGESSSYSPYSTPNGGKPVGTLDEEQQVVDQDVEGVQTDIESKTHTQVQGVEEKPSRDDELLVRNPMLSLTT